MIDAKDVLAVATASLPGLLAKALPNGNFRFGGEYASPHPNASAKRQRDYRADIVVNSRGASADNLSGARGSNVISLLAHLQNRSVGEVGADLARSLNPADALNGRIVRPGVTVRSKEEDSGNLLARVDAVMRENAADHLAKGHTRAQARADALLKVAQEQAPKRKAGR